MCKKNGFSLVEVIVATLIFSLVVLGFLGVFVAGNGFTIHSRDRITSAELVKFFLDPLQMHVREDTWNTVGNSLRLGVAAPTVRVINGRTFTENHTVFAPVGTTDLRRVTSTITWQEPAS